MTREEAIEIVGKNMPSDKSLPIYEALQTLIPELAESEDEIHRKWILEYLYEGLQKSDEQFKEQFKSAIAYLEKQKEQIPYTDFVIKPHKGDDNNPYDMSLSEAQEYVFKRGFGIPYNDGEVYVDERHITQTIGNILRWADEHPKEQKPDTRDADDLQLLGFIYDLLNEIKWKDSWAMSKDECLQRLKSLCPQPKQERSMVCGDDRFEIIGRAKQDLLDKTNISDSLLEMMVIDNFLFRCWQMGWLKKYGNNWKPTDEQMEALGYAITGDFDKISPTSYLSRRLEEIEEFLNTLR